MKIEIERVENGTIISYEEEGKRQQVFTIDQYCVDLDSLKNLSYMHYVIGELLGFHGSKHDKYRLFHQIIEQETEKVVEF